MKLLRFLLKLIISPVVLVLTILVAIGKLLVTCSAVLMNIIAFVLFVLGIGMIIILRAPWSEVWKPFFLGWLLSPYGLPFIAGILVGTVGAAKDALKSI